MRASVGRSVRYVLSAADVHRIEHRRASYHASAGNPVHVGDVVPMTIVRVWLDEFGAGIPGVNGQAVLDGFDSLWVTSVREGSEPGTWHWPTRD